MDHGCQSTTHQTIEALNVVVPRDHLVLPPALIDQDPPLLEGAAHAAHAVDSDAFALHQQELVDNGELVLPSQEGSGQAAAGNLVHGSLEQLLLAHRAVPDGPPCLQSQEVQEQRHITTNIQLARYHICSALSKGTV